MKLKVFPNLSIKIADIINGKPNPMEYVKSNNIPLKTVPEVEAIISADPKNAPTHGVKFIENTIPNRKAENIFFIFCPLLIPLKIEIFIIPK